MTYPSQDPGDLIRSQFNPQYGTDDSVRGVIPASLGPFGPEQRAVAGAADPGGNLDLGILGAAYDGSSADGSPPVRL